MPEHLSDVWPAYRLWLEKGTSLEALDSTLSLDDVLNANDALDLMARAQELASKRKTPEK